MSHTIVSRKSPLLDQGRLVELARLQVHLTRVDDILNGLVQEAAAIMGLPIGLVTVLLDSAQKFEASYGLQGWLAESSGTPLEWSFCTTSVRTRQPLRIHDATAYERTKNNPLVTQDNIRCYAGAPLITKNGYVVGNFCVMGQESRLFTEAEMETLREYAKKAMDRLEAVAASAA